MKHIYLSRLKLSVFQEDSYSFSLKEKSETVTHCVALGGRDLVLYKALSFLALSKKLIHLLGTYFLEIKR